MNVFNLYCIKNRIKNIINIDKDFPKDKLIKIMQPYLLLFIMSQFAYLETQQKEASYFLNKVLINFSNFNPKFGRKKYKIITKQYDFKTKIIGKIIEFDDKHIKFIDNDKQKNKFLCDHLKYEENLLLFDEDNNEVIEEEDEDEDEDDEEEDEEEENHFSASDRDDEDDYNNSQYFQEEASHGSGEGVNSEPSNEEYDDVFEEDSIS
jgi:hypothetical protein